MQINKLLQNSVRTELFGNNMFLSTKSVMPRNWDFEKMGRLSPANVWEEPRFAMSGRLGLAHESEIFDPCSFEIYKNGEKLCFHSVRNLWTPAYMETFYRCMPESEYKRSGLVGVKERKCINDKDCFVSEVTLFNDDNEPCELEVNILSSLQIDSAPFFSVKSKTIPRGLGRIFDLNGFFCISSPLGYNFKVKLEKSSSFTFRFAAAYAPKKRDTALKLCERTLGEKDPFKKNEKNFDGWFKDNVPTLKCENQEVLKTYYYRFFLIKKCTFTPREMIPEHIAKGEVFYESATGSWYGCPIGLPTPMQIEEGKWLKGARAAKSHIDFWLDGYCRGYIQFTPFAAWNYYTTHKDKAWLKENYRKFVEYTFKKLDIENSEKLPVTDGSWPTGAEYQPSFYQHTPTPWDYRYDNRRKDEVGGERQKLYRLDEITYAIANIGACEKMAKELGFTEDSARLSRFKDELVSVLKERFFSKKRGMFADMDVLSGKLCDEAICYDSFAPLMWGVVDGEEYLSSLEKLFDTEVFLSEFYPPSAERKTPMFWFDNAVVGPAFASKSEADYYGCCWNGPVWPYANTLVLLALGFAAKQSKKYREKWLSLFENYTSLHYYLGDFSVPDVVEHYRHTDGLPFSVTHDYFHSCYIDFVMSYWAGISVSDNGRVKFSPLTDEEFEISGVELNYKTYNFKQYRENGRLKRKIEIN